MKAALFSACLLLLLANSCDAMNQTTAERCVYVELYGQKGKELIPLLDAFAEENGLVPDKSHPISPSYERSVNNAIIADLVYTIGMGDFGAELALFRFDKSKSSDLLDAFDRLVEHEIAPRYKVDQCSEDQYPVVYR